jgi:putative transposase
MDRYQRCAELHFLTFSCYDRLPYLGTPTSRDLFLVSLETVRRDRTLSIYGYVAMPEHVHLLLGAPDGVAIDSVVEELKDSVAQRLERRPCWLGGFDDLKVHTDRQRTDRMMYIHRNPVMRGLVRAPGDWRWSSFQACSTGVAGLVEVVAV